MVKVRPFQIAISLIKRNRGSIQLIICKRIKKIICKKRKRYQSQTCMQWMGGKRGGCEMGSLTCIREFFLFLYYFFRFIKNICRDIFFQKCHPATGSSGGRLLPPDEPAVGSFRAGPWWAVVGRALPPVETAVGGTYRRMIRR